MEGEIKAEFEKGGFSIEDEGQVLTKCLTFCINYKLKPSDLVSSWVVYYLNRQLGKSTVQHAEMEGFLLHLQNEQKAAVIKEEPHLHVYSSNDIDILLSEEHEDTEEGILGTPTDRSKKLNPEPFASTPGTTGNKFSSRKSLNLETPFGQRSRKFVVQFTFNKPPNSENEIKEDNENLEDNIIRRIQPSEMCSLIVRGSRPERDCRFMYNRIEDRFNFLDNRITRFAKALVSSGCYQEPVDPTVASQKTVFAVGMICCDGEGHLNEKSILLQCSVEHSGGRRVRLELQKLNHFSIFPGQVVGVEGHNLSGHYLEASKIVDSIPFLVCADVDIPASKRQALDQEVQPTGLPPKFAELSLIIAAGPFTTTDNLFFEPLAELLAYASRKMPQLLVLVGPFIDSEHDEIKKGTVDRSFDDIFHLEVLTRLKNYVEYMGSTVRVILVPSIRDANHDFVFPQPSFDIRTPDLNNQIECITNPGIFEANGVKVGCSSVDILKQLSGEEISRITADGNKDRKSRLAKHILSQHSFYPLYPQAESVPLDVSIAPEALQVSVVPDILILPSDLIHFVKVLSVEGGSQEEQVKCMCVNPGRLAKGRGAGTFAELNYHWTPDATVASIISI